MAGKLHRLLGLSRGDFFYISNCCAGIHKDTKSLLKTCIIIRGHMEVAHLVDYTIVVIQ